MIYGYCRVSNPKQNMLRQIKNIQEYSPDAKIFQETFTGTTSARPEWMKLIKKVKSGDTIIFDSVSRMSRNADEGIEQYLQLFNGSVELVFLKEPHINTSVYKSALNGQISLTGTNVDIILDGINKYLLSLAKQQIRIAFDQAEKEVMDLRQRTKEGIQIAKMNGKQPGRRAGSEIVTKKKIMAKKTILEKSKDFNGTYDDKDLMKIIGISKGTYYKYKKELKSSGN